MTGTVKLTLANSAPSSASAYERRAVGPRPKAQPELRNVVIFFSDLPATKAGADAGVDRAEGRAVRAARGRRHGGIERRVPERGSVLSQRVLAVARRRVQPGPLSVGREPLEDVHAARHRQGVLRDPLAHERGDPRVRSRGSRCRSRTGTFTIDNVPPGDHTLVAWHERIGERRDRVTIRAGAATQITFTLPVLEPGQ